jgi:hypothetical protein
MIEGVSESWQAQEDALFALIQAAAIAGSLSYVNGLGATVVVSADNVDRVSPPDGESFPRIGLQYMSTTESSGALGQRNQQNTFELTVIIQSDFEPSRSDIARAAFEQCTNLVNDRNGNGLLPLIRSNPTLSGTANWVLPQDQKIVLLTDDDPSSLSALWTCQIVAQGRIFI